MNPRPRSTCDLSLSERRFLDAMSELGFGRFEQLRIAGGEVVNPWPVAVQIVKFGSAEAFRRRALSDEFELKSQVADFFEYVRAMKEAEIRCLEIRYGSPVLMEIETRPQERR